MFEMQLDGDILRAVQIAFDRYKRRTDIPEETKVLSKLHVGITQFKNTAYRDLVDIRLDSEPPYEEDFPLQGRKFTHSYLIRLSDGKVLQEYQRHSGVYY